MNYRPSIHREFEPGRVWSLWDMLKLDANAFYRVALNINSAQVLIEERNHSTAEYSNPMGDLVVIRHLLQRAQELRDSLSQLGANITISIVDEHIWQLNSDIKPSPSEIVEYYKYISKALEHELSSIKIFIVSSDKAQYNEPKDPLFGAEFNTKYASRGRFEVDEAAKCIAFGRPTAAVFHLMRVLEVGIRSIARCLNIPDPIKPAERNWGKMLDAIKQSIAAKWPTAADRMSDDAIVFEGLLASLDAIKNPWRNSTMHVENKYTDDEAEHIFVAIKGFMKKLASRMDEEGLPRA